ncbi:PucR family transcriptional regulator [Sinomonas terrae]|uniref:PucR family transcriptional regulator ligand-binding domain-containing protein n=1 Tax=Sinomonas terrae TaxID=2908838 RepID=A0ABS9U4S3_9MICC|nr:PucR family transcriptional regulator [Sinomonas terrae]MCH6471679.1 PucR family transcriptional regulator ligand-binding domain-containing protein [Sinomonas terrae]
MSIPLDEILTGEALRFGDPAVVGGASVVPGRRVRWVHSSEVVQIAPLLRGGELLLTGGQAFLGLRPGAQLEYVRSLAERSVAGVAVETLAGRRLSDDVLAAADELGLPLIELRRVVPFVEVAEAVNRRIVSRQVEALQAADALSQRLTERMAVSGSSLGPLLALAAEALGAAVVVVDDSGAVLEAAGHADESVVASVPLGVGGVDVARLEFRGGAGADASLIETVAPRVRGIVALALAQHHRPSLARMADDALLRMVLAGGGGDQLLELAEASGLGLETPVAAAIFRSSSSAPPSAAVERALRGMRARARLQADGDTAVALLTFDPGREATERGELVAALRDALARTGTVGALGPTTPNIRGASASLVEARTTLRLGRASKWDYAVYDSADFVVERFAERELSRQAAQAFVQETLGPLIELEQKRGGELVRTLDVWITAGCNTADAARTLFLERQSLHKRLARIFGALGGDPRGTGRLGALAFAVKLARGNAQLRDGN